MAEINLKDIPDDLKKRLKVRAAVEGKTMRDFILETLDAAAQDRTSA